MRGSITAARTARQCGVWVVLCLAATAGCGPPRVDATTGETYEDSLQRVRDALPEDRRAGFDRAVVAILADRVNLESLQQGRAAEDPGAHARHSLSGRTAEEIFEEAARLDAASKRLARAGVEREIGALVARQESAFAARAALKRFEVNDARFAGRADSRSQPPIRVRVANGTGYRVTRLHLEVSVERPGRQAPWLSEEVSFTPQVAIEPGASASWTLEPGVLRTWGTVAVPADAVPRITVMAVEGPDRQPLLDARGYTEEDAARLVALQLQLAHLETGEVKKD
jgi:hypothetical protein